MDLLTHAIAGAALGEAVAGRRLGRRSMAVGAGMALVPDLDVLGHFFLSHAGQMSFHRGITHSLLVTAVLALALAALCQWRVHAEGMTWKRWLLLFLLPLLSHLLLDSLTCYGTGLFEPFSSYRVALDTIFVVDPFLTLPWLVILLVVLARYRHAHSSRRWNFTGLWFAGAYVALTCVNHIHVKAVMRSSFQEQGLTCETFQVTPTPLNNLLWMAYSQDPQGAWIGYYSLLDADDAVQFVRVPKNDALRAPYTGDPALEQLIWQSKGNYCLIQRGDDVIFSDLRFGFLSRWEGLDSAFAMEYNLRPGAENPRPLHRTRFREPSMQVLGRLVDRVLGNENRIQP